MPFHSGLLGACIWLLATRIDASTFTQLPSAIRAVPLALWGMAAGFAALSFWAVARYDGVAHRHFQTGVRARQARISGFAAIAIAQTVGFGILTGAAVRWRMLPQLGLSTALHLSTLVSITFMLALAFLTALACLVLPAPAWLTLPAIGVALLIPAAIFTISFAPLGAPLRHRLRLPSLRASGAILGWAALDITAAAAALYLLIPATDLSLTFFLPAFLLALGAAMLSGAPGGVGPFELMLFSLLPTVPTPDLIAGIVGFRALYYALPALIGVAMVFSPSQSNLTSAVQTRSAPIPATKAEIGVLAQNGGRLLHHDQGTFALWKTTQTATMLFDPLAGSAAPALNRLKTVARTSNLVPCIYKCGEKTALTARKLGWRVVRVADDFHLDLETYDPDTPARRGLRRKLRKAERAGVCIQRATTLPLDAMAEVDANWQTAHGRARGGSMGRFCPAYLMRQEVFLAYLGGDLVAFASFHTSGNGLCLDLMRHLEDLPDGTMHLLLHHAIDAARHEGYEDISLAAVPSLPDWMHRIAPLQRRLDKPGLRQFKSSFAPTRHARYAAAPDLAALAIALCDIATEVHQPRPLPQINPPHDQDEDYEVALNEQLWKGT